MAKSVQIYKKIYQLIMIEDKPQVPAEDGLLRMRYYERQFPLENQLVMGEIKESEQNGSQIQLLQYDRKIAMLPIVQYSKQFRKTVHRAIKTGKKQVFVVLRVDTEGYIDISKKSVQPKDQKAGQQKYHNAKAIHSILYHIAKETEAPIKHLYQTIIWPLQAKQLDPLSMLKSLVHYPLKISQFNIQNQSIKKSLLKDVNRRFKTSIVKTVAVVNLTVRHYDGIKVIKAALKKGIEEAQKESHKVEISIIGAPKYMLHVSTNTIDLGVKVLKLTMDKIKEVIESYENSQFSIYQQPKTVGDPNALFKQILDQENDNAEGEHYSDSQDQTA